jgi:hypothetical protein
MVYGIIMLFFRAGAGQSVIRKETEKKFFSFLLMTAGTKFFQGSKYSFLRNR